MLGSCREDHQIAMKITAMKYHRTAVLSMAFATLFVLAQHAANASQRPNIVFILADDLGYGDVEAFGGDNCNVDTPHFDRLCADGIKFTNAHVTDSVCVPSRTSIMTGRYAFRFGNAEQGGPWGFAGLRFPTTQHTLGDMFQSGGYNTGYVGKWHLGTRMATRDGEVQGPANTDFTQPIQVGPSDYGFADCFFLPGSLDMFPYAFVRGKKWQGKVIAKKGWSAFNRVGPAAEEFVDTAVLPTICHETGRFINAQATKNEPFFLYVALTAPHTPTSPEAEFEGKSRVGIYGDFVMNTDACIGRIRDHLHQAGVDQNTVIMVSSDHGPGHYSGRNRKATANQMQAMEKDGHRPTGHWRGYKFSAFEGGLRVPLATVWPGVVKPGSETEALVGLNDLMATWADIAEIKLSANHAPDSISFFRTLKNPATRCRETLVTRGTRTNAFCDGKWKLILGPGSGSSGEFYSEPKSEDAWKTALKSIESTPASHEDLENSAFVQLYNLKVDPGETKDVSAENMSRVKKMLANYEATIQEGRSTPGPKLSNDRDAKAFRPPAFIWRK